MIDSKNFYLLWGEALESSDRDTYVSEWSTSSIWQEDADLLAIADKLARIWDVAHMSVTDIRRAAGMTQMDFAQRFCVPKRSVENWCSGSRKCPDYIRLMMAELLGIIDR